MKESCAFLCGNREIRLCGCRGVDKYTVGERVLVMCDMYVRVLGAELTLSSFRNGEISVAGLIETVQLLKNRGANDE